MTSFAIGAKLRQERASRGLSIADIAHYTRIPSRHLEAIENDDFSELPGLVFTRNFVRQYALALNLDPDPLLAELPRQDESTVQLPNPPERKRSSYQQDRRVRSVISSLIWIVVAGGAGMLAYVHYNGSGKMTPHQVEASSAPDQSAPASGGPPASARQTEQPSAAVSSSGATPAAEKVAPVNVVLTAHAPAWIEVTADGKTAFVGTLQTDETRNISAAEQVKVVTGNAGALTVSLNGKTLESLGPVGQVRTVRLTAEGPAPLAKAPPPAPDPL